MSGSPWRQRSQSDYYELINTSSLPYLTASTGIWHQSGNIIKEGDLKGYYLTVESGEHDLESSKGDLASELGFIDKKSRIEKNYSTKPFKTKKLGKIANSKSPY